MLLNKIGGEFCTKTYSCEGRGYHQGLNFLKTLKTG